MLKAAACMAIFLALAAVGSAQSAEDRDKLWGTWKTDAASPGGTLALAEKDGNLHYQFLQSDEKKADFACNVVGRDCKVKADGKEATVSFYFNGPKLVQWEKVGDKVVKRRFSIADGGEVLEMETTSIVPAGKPETVRLRRASEAATVATTQK